MINYGENMNLKRYLKKINKYIFVPFFIAVISWASYFYLYGNFHKVDNDVYRSAQLFSFNMPYYLEKHNIKSILNMRNLETSQGKDWYENEKEISRNMNIAHIDYPIFNREEASMTQMNEIVRIIKNAPKPLLIHCKAGADRTSLASALYRYAIRTDKNAEEELSILYGHFPWLGSKTGAMDRSFKKYQSATNLSLLQF